MALPEQYYIPKRDKTLTSMQPGQKYGPSMLPTSWIVKYGEGSVNGSELSIRHDLDAIWSQDPVALGDNVYVEFKILAGPQYFMLIGINTEGQPLNKGLNLDCAAGVIIMDTGSVPSEGQGKGAVCNINDVVGLHLDRQAETLEFYKNGTALGSINLNVLSPYNQDGVNQYIAFRSRYPNSNGAKDIRVEVRTSPSEWEYPAPSGASMLGHSI